MRMAWTVPILHEDAHVLFVSKPGGMLSQPDYTGDEDLTVWVASHLRQSASDDPFVGLVHRLDRPASGAMVLAKTPDAARHLTDQFKQRQPTKRYVALVSGAPTLLGSFEDYLVKENGTVKTVSPSNPAGKHAALRYQRLAVSEGMALVDITLETGRSHQIRVQFSSRGHAVLGDVRYGGSSAFDEYTIALHAYHLSVDHPETGRPVGVSAPLPDTWPAFAREALEPRLKMLS